MNFKKYAKKTLEIKGIPVTVHKINELAKTIENTFNQVFKAVAFDVDGTLTKKDSTEIDDDMSLLIGELLTRGVHVLLISGRGRGSMREAARQIIEKSSLSSGYVRRLSCIAHNGVYWLKTQSQFFPTLLSNEEIFVEKPVGYLDEIKKQIQDCGEFKKYIEDELIAITEEPTENPYLLRVAFDQKLYKQEQGQSILTNFNVLLKSIITGYKQIDEEIYLTQATYGGNYLFNISNTNKTVALNKYADKIGINPVSILRIGDQGHYSGNDYELLDCPTGFSVGTIGSQGDACFPVLDHTCKNKLDEVIATRFLLKRVLLFPPLSLEPNYHYHQLKALHEFEEACRKTSKR